MVTAPRDSCAWGARGVACRNGAIRAIQGPMKTSHVLALALSLTLSGCPANTDWEEAFDATDTGWLLSVWGPAPDDLYAVGGTPDEGTVVHFDGASWAPLDLGVETPLLNWSFGFGASDVFVVGNEGTILHYDGAAWTQQTTPTTENLWGIWGASPSDVYAVGGSGRVGSVATLLHYDGSAWSDVELPELERTTRAFFKIWGSGPDDIVVVGQSGILLRWDGTVWNEIGVGTSEDLIAVWGTGPDRIAVVGGRSNGIVVTWDGTEWHMERLSPLLGLNGVWMRDPDVIHVVGIDGTLARVDFRTRVYREDLTDVRIDFHAIFGDSSGRVTTVGGNFASTSGPYEGIAYTRLLRSDE